MISHLWRSAVSLRNRYHAKHIHLSQELISIIDSNETVVGCIERAEIKGGTLQVTGWVLKTSTVRLVFLGAQTESTPHIHREDVAKAMGCPENVGFELSLHLNQANLEGTNLPGLTFEKSDPADASIPPTSLSFSGIGYAHFRADLGLLKRAPQLIFWGGFWLLARKDPIKRKIVRILDLNRTKDLQTLELNKAIFDQPAEAPTDAPRVTIILPMYNAFELLPDVFERVLKRTDLPFHLIAIDDASPDKNVWPWVSEFVQGRPQDPARQITLLRNETNLGFIGTVNRGIELAMHNSPACQDGISEGPVILLNSDAFVPENWVQRLIQPLLNDADVATTTPMSNDAEIFSVPQICCRSDLPTDAGDAIDAAAKNLNNGAAEVIVPTGVGFCMAISRNWLEKVGMLDSVFGRGYGEEVDWCQRARAMGARHLAVRNLFVEHRGGTSFGSEEKLAIVKQNNAIISSRYTDYDDEVRSFIQNDPMASERIALGIVWADQIVRSAGARLPIYFGHSMGGGAEIYLKNEVTKNVDTLGAAVVVRVGGAAPWQIEIHSRNGVSYGTLKDTGFLKKLLAGAKKRDIIYSCGVGVTNPLELTDLLAELRRPEDRLCILVHDFFMISPSYTLTSEKGVFLSTPLSSTHSDDPAHTFTSIANGEVALKDWQSHWGQIMTLADRIVVFSNDSAAHIEAAYPVTKSKTEVVPHTLPFRPRPVDTSTAHQNNGNVHIGVLGGINAAKGAFVLQAIGDHIARGTFRGKLTVIGSVDPTVTLSPHVTIHGQYDPKSISDLAEYYGITHWLVPSIWPETFSFTTHECLATGLPVLTFDLGAQAETASRVPNGHVLPFSPFTFEIDHFVGHLVENIINFLMVTSEQKREYH